MIRLLISLLLLLSIPCIGNAAEASARVGVIYSSDNQQYRNTFASFAETLERLGYGPEKLSLYVQKPNADIFSWANSARRADAIGVSALVIFGTSATHAALREHSKLPVVFAGGMTPLTGSIDRLPPLSEKALRRASGIQERLPVATLIKTFVDLGGGGTIAAVFLEDDLDSMYQLAQLRHAAKIYGLEIMPVLLKSGYYSEGLSKLPRHADAFYVASGIFSDVQLKALVSRIRNLKRPLLGFGFGLAEQGAIVSIESNPAEHGALAAEHLVKILRGAAPDTLSIAHVQKVDLVLNLTMAKSLDMDIPFNVLTAATRIIH